MSATIELHCDYVTRITPQGPVKCGALLEQATQFALAPESYVVELCDEHKEELAEILEPFISIARTGRAVISVTTRGRKVLKGHGGKEFTTADVREWLVAQGRLEDAGRGGRIANKDIEEYKALL